MATVASRSLLGILRLGIGVRISSDCTYPRREPSAAKMTELVPLSCLFSSSSSGALAAVATT